MSPLAERRGRSECATPEPDGPEVLVVGVGAMACLVAARLARSGVGVALAGTWPAGLDSIRARGVVLEEPEAHSPPEAWAVETFDRTEHTPRAPYVFVLVKAHQTASVAQYAAAAVKPGGLVITLQNGLGNREILAGAAREAHVVAGTTSAGATLIGPGHVRAGGPGQTVLGPSAAESDGRALGRGAAAERGDATPASAPGDVAGRNRTTYLAGAAGILSAAGLPARIVADVDPYLWLKLCVNAGINPVTALLGRANEALLAGEPRRIALLATSEAAAVAGASGITLPADPLDAMLTVVANTRANRSSMLQDAGRGARTEVDAITGEVVRHGRRTGVPTPVNDWLLEQVHILEEGGHPQPLETTLEPVQS